MNGMPAHSLQLLQGGWPSWNRVATGLTFHVSTCSGLFLEAAAHILAVLQEESAPGTPMLLATSQRLF